MNLSTLVILVAVLKLAQDVDARSNTKIDRLEDMLNLAFDEFDVKDVEDVQQKFSSLSQEEAMATKFEDRVHTVYERKRPKVEEKTDRVKYRIKSSDDLMPPTCTSNGKPGSRLVCPTPMKEGSRWWTCIMPSELCDGVKDCDGGEDEDPKFCMFHKASSKTFDSFKKSIVHQLDRIERELHKLVRSSDVET